MEIKVEIADIAKVKADAIIINLFEGQEHPSGATAAVDKVLGGAISNLISLGEIKGKFNEVNIIHSLGKIPARIVAIAGLGKQSEFTADRIRKVMAVTCRCLRKLHCSRIATIVHGAGAGGIESGRAASAIVEGSISGLYEFKKHITKKDDNSIVEKLTLVEISSDKKIKLEKGCVQGQIVADATNFARDLINEPANYMTPTDLARIAGEVAQSYGLKLAVYDSIDMKEMGMGALLGVAQGSEQPPKLIVLNYEGDKKSAKKLGYIGKGLTFDSGGISIKPSENMHEMKGDMSGGAAVIAALSAIARLKPKVNVMGIIPATENLPSGKALKPGDVLMASNGKTIEVVNTDAEGRLILADALSYAVKNGAEPLIDIATLTGACHIALGSLCSGVFTNNQELVEKIINAGADVGERFWQMPMYEEYKELNKSDVADIKNSGGRWGGAITAAQFLSEFANDKPWVHIDIAGTFFSDKDNGYIVKGATGVCVRMLVNFALNSVNQKST